MLTNTHSLIHLMPLGRFLCVIDSGDFRARSDSTYIQSDLALNSP